MSNEKYISEMHNDHKFWHSQLLLAKDQLTSFQNRLEEVNAANTNKEILAQVEHFQNQFIREIEVMDELIHDINSDELRLAENAKANNIAVEHRKTTGDTELYDRMKSFNKIFNDLNSEFILFLSRTL
jgi:hypothetical protein